MAKVTVRPSNICRNGIFDGNMNYADVVDMVENIGEVDEVVITKPSIHLTHSNNIHHIHFTRDDVMFDIHLTEKQFKEMLPLFKKMGEVKI